MTTVEVDNLKAELHRLNGHIQAERNDEVRHGLQRCRLENERALLLIKLIDAAATPPPPTCHVETAPAAAVAPPPLAEPLAQPLRGTPVRKHKPAGLPTIPAMIVTALQATGKASRPVEIADYVRKRWWPDLESTIIGTQAWHMAKIGKLTCRDGRYGLNGAGH